MVIGNHMIHWVLVDNGSSADILYKSAFDLMKIGKDKLSAFRFPLVGFAGEQVMPLGSIELQVTVGNSPTQKTIPVRFLIVDQPSAYNAIFGRTAQAELKAVTSIPHLKMKFPTDDGVGEVRGEQKAARKCYNVSLGGSSRQAHPGQEAGPVAKYQLQARSPTGDLEDVEFGPHGRKLRIGAQLPTGEKEKLVEFLRDHLDVFAWEHDEMPGIDPSIIEHRLNVDWNCRPVKQRRRSFASERNQAIADEVQKLIKAEFIQEVDYPEWLANVVLVKKANGKWRMCVDFTDLNKACPKDSFPLPRIDQLVDLTAGHEVLSFMDAFFGYNQIRMAESDQEKTSFTTDRGLYCHTVMPFGLKNVGATYQRLVNKMFQTQIGRNMEVYVDDMLVKSLTTGGHVADLAEAFENLRSRLRKVFGVHGIA